MSIIKKIVLIFVCILFSFALYADTVETIVVVRHAEKPARGLGQLTCQGLNRALALPSYFKKNFPHADYIFAPNPAFRVQESRHDSQKYSYVRPLITIEPTAIALGLPVNTQIGYRQTGQLVSELLQSKYHHATIYVAWEHLNIEKIAQLILSKFDNKAAIPLWANDNYQMVYVFTIHWSKNPAVVTFKVLSENLHGLSNQCPTS